MESQELIHWDQLEKNLHRGIYKDSYYEFFKDAFAQLHPGESYDENWHIEYLCGILQEEFERIQRKDPRKKDIIINVPFRAAKSMITTVIFPVWCWSIDPQFKFICVSFAESLALEHAQLSRDLMRSVWFQRLWGDKVKIRHDASALSFYKTTDGGFRKSVGTGGQITGSGSDIIIVDDPQNPKKAASETERDNAKKFYDHTLFSRLNQPDVGVRIVVMQRLHEEDVTGHLMDEKDGRPDDHRHICIPGEIDNNLEPKELAENYVNGLFWFTRFNKGALASYNKALGDLQYAGQVQQRPAPLEGNLLRRSWFEIVDAEDVKRDFYKDPIHFVLDTAYTEKQENDPSGIMAYFIREGDIYIINVAEEWKTFPDLCEWVKEYVKVNDYSEASIVRVEPKASGKSLVQQLKRETGMNIVEIESDMLKDDKTTRVNTISPICQAGRVKLIRGNWNEKFLTQATTFPNAKHDEFVDDLCYAIDQSLLTNQFSWGFL